MERNRHLDEVMAHAWIDGELSAGEAEWVEAHVRGCERCAGTVAEARGVIAAAARIVGALDLGRTGVVPRTKRHRRLSWWAVRVAASLVLVVGGAGTIFIARTRSDVRPSVPAAASAASADQGAGLAEDATVPAAPVAVVPKRGFMQRRLGPMAQSRPRCDSATDSTAAKKCRRDSVPK